MNASDFAQILNCLPVSEEIERPYRGRWSNVSEETGRICKCCHKLLPFVCFLKANDWLPFFSGEIDFPDEISTLCLFCASSRDRRRGWDAVKKELSASKRREREADLSFVPVARYGYAAYIASPAWDKRKEFLKGTRVPKCEVCSGTYFPIHCHHLHYGNLGRETRADVAFLCAACHAAAHAGAKKSDHYPIEGLKLLIWRALLRRRLTKKKAHRMSPKNYALGIVKLFGVGNHLFLRGLL